MGPTGFSLASFSFPKTVQAQLSSNLNDDLFKFDFEFLLFVKIIIFALVPLILSIGIIPVLPFSYSEELVCPSGEVEVVRVTNPNSICIDQGTAHRWTQLGIAETVGEPTPTVFGRKGGI